MAAGADEAGSADVSPPLPPPLADNRRLTAAQMAELSPIIASLPSHTDILLEVKTSLVEATRMTRSQAIRHLRIRLEPTVLVNDEMATKRHIYRTILRLLTELGMEPEPEEGVSVVNLTIDTLFDRETHTDANIQAKDLYRRHVQGRSSGTSISNISHHDGTNSLPHHYPTTDSSAIPPRRDDSYDSLSKKLSSASYNFRDSSHRFSGSYDCEVSLQRFKQLFSATCEQYSIPMQHRVPLLTNALQGAALDFYLDSISGKNKTIAEAFDMLTNQFDSPATRASALSFLESITLAQIRENENCNTSRALEIAIRRISTVAPMCGPAFQADEHKGRWLANMLKTETWAQQSCINRMTMVQDYKTFKASLHSALTQLSISNSTPRTSSHRKDMSEMAASTYYGRRYAFPSNRRRFPVVRPYDRTRRRRTPEELRKLKQNSTCLRCGQMGHWRAECPRRDISMTDAIKARLSSSGSNHAAIQDALIALVHDEDEYCTYLTEIGGQTPQPLGDITNSCAQEWHIATDPTPFDALHEASDARIDDASPGHNAETENSPVGISTNFISDDSASSQDEQMTHPINIVFTTAQLSENTTAPLRRPPHKQPTFLGALIDTGAQKTVIGTPQASAYLKKFGGPLIQSAQRPRFRFGSQISEATHLICVKIPTPISTIMVYAPVVPADVPLLIGLDTLLVNHLQPLLSTKELVSITQGWSLPLAFDRGHLYLRWTPTDPTTNTPYICHTPEPTPILHGRLLSLPVPIHNTTSNARRSLLSVQDLLNPTALPGPLKPSPGKTQSLRFTNQELTRIHRHFGHASARKLYELLCRSSLKPPAHVLQQLEALVSAGKTCTEFAPRPVAFRVREPDSTLFNHKLILDLMWLTARVPQRSRSTRPVLHMVDAGTRFNAATFINDESAVDVWNAFVRAWSCTYVGMPSSLMVDQGSVFISDEWKFGCEMNAIELIATGTESHNSLGVGETYHAYLRRIYNKVHADFPRLPDEIVLALAVKAINDTTGPKGLCPTLLVFGTLPTLPTPSKRDHPNQIDRFRAAAAARREYEIIVHDERLRFAARKPPPPATNAIYKPGDMVYVYREKDRKYSGPHMIASIQGKAVRLHIGDRTGPRDFNIAQLRPSPLPNAQSGPMVEPRYPRVTHHTEVLRPNDPRARLFAKHKHKELLGLLERGVFRICTRQEAGEHPNIVPSRFVLAIKHGQNKEPPRLKARFVLGGHKDRDKTQILHDSKTVRPESVRLLISLATTLKFKLALADWKQGYAQSKSNLLRKVYVRPKELLLDDDELVQVMRPLYGLPDAGEYWSDTLIDHLRNHCGFQQSITDPSMWFRMSNSSLVAIAATYVDDVLIAGTQNALNEFRSVSERRFDVTLDMRSEITYLGTRIRTMVNGSVEASQPRQIARMKLLPETCTFATYRSARASLAWLQQTRPDIACAISFGSRITEDKFNRHAIGAYNKVVRYLRRSGDRLLKFKPLDFHSIRLIVYVDAGHRNIAEGHSQLGYLILLGDRFHNCSIIAYSSRKSRRVVRSTVAGEGLAFADGFDASFAIQADMKQLLPNKHIPIVMLTDSDVLFGTITQRKTTTEKRMMVDLAMVREAYDNREIANIALIHSDDNPSDALSKIDANPSLRNLMDTYTINHPIIQFVAEKSARKHPSHSTAPMSDVGLQEDGRCVATKDLVTPSLI